MSFLYRHYPLPLPAKIPLRSEKVVCCNPQKLRVCQTHQLSQSLKIARQNIGKWKTKKSEEFQGPLPPQGLIYHNNRLHPLPLPTLCLHHHTHSPFIAASTSSMLRLLCGCCSTNIIIPLLQIMLLFGLVKHVLPSDFDYSSADPHLLRIHQLFLRLGF